MHYETRYCIDDGTSRAIANRLGPDGYGIAYNLAYVLRTANSWAGPIGSFRLTLDKRKGLDKLIAEVEEANANRD